MNKYSYLSDIKNIILKDNLTDLETSFFDIASQLADKETAVMISQIDLTAYSQQLAEAYEKANRLTNTKKSKAIYFEFDMDDNWQGVFFLCSRYKPEKEGNDDWACEWEHKVAGPGNSDFAKFFQNNGFDETPKAIGITSYLIARTVTVFWGIVKSRKMPSVSVCIGYHDQNIVFRINEVLPETKRGKSSGYFFIDRIAAEGMGVACLPKGIDLLDFYNQIKSSNWQPCTFEIKDGCPTDLLNTSISYDFYSPKLRECIERCRLPEDKIRWLEVFAKTENGSVLPYYILDLHEGINALNINETRFHVGTYTGRPCLHKNIVKKYCVFTIQYPQGYSGSNGVIVAGLIKDAIENEGFTGIRFEKVKTK
jgi:hypothetical protein